MSANNEDIIIRFSGAWWAYMICRLGFLRAAVNGVEDALAITGRFLLLIFLMYCGAKAGLLLVQPTASLPVWLEVSMFLLQLAGLEGSIPGLARQADVLRASDEHDAARKVDRVMTSARVMTVLAIAEGAAHALQLDIHLLQWASAILLVARGIVITGFLVALARIESKAPRILSKEAHAHEQEEKARNSEQARTIADLRKQLQQMQENASSWQGKLSEAETLATQVSDLQSQISQVIQENQQLTSAIERSQAEVREVTGQLQRSQQEVVDLTSKLEKVTSSTGQQEVKAKRSQVTRQRSDEVSSEEVKEVNRSQGAVLQFVPRADEARRKHDPLEVKAWCDLHPDLTQAEQAAQLGISDAANLRRLLRRARDLEVGGQAANDQ